MSIEVLVSAANADFPEEHAYFVDDEIPSVIDGRTDPLEIVKDPRVQARFACGRELAAVIQPVVEMLDQAN